MCLSGVLTFDLILTFDFVAIIDFNWLRMISSVSGRYLGKRSLNCFHTAHTNPWGGVDVPFRGYDLWPNFLPVILRRLSTSFNFGDKFSFRTISHEAFPGLFSNCTHTSLRGCRCAFWVMTFDLIVDLQFWGHYWLFNWWRIISLVSGWYLRKHLLDCFYIAYTYLSGGVDVPFGGCDLWPICWPLILKPLLTI